MGSHIVRSTRGMNNAMHGKFEWKFDHGKLSENSQTGNTDVISTFEAPSKNCSVVFAVRTFAEK